MRVAPYSSNAGGSASLVRDRGCMYYVPWIVILLLMLMAAAVGVWAYFSNQARNYTQNGLNALGVSSSNFDKLKPGAIATVVVFIVVLCSVAALGFAFAFVEAALDATGTAGTGSQAFLILNGIQGVLWYLITIWLIFVLIACSLWSSSVYLLRGSIDQHLTVYANYPPATWYPSSGLPCPSTCFDLTYFTFVSSNFANSCTCDQTQLRNAYNYFNDAYTKDMIAVLVGSFVMLVSASLLGMNLACQFSHTKRHRELISRATKQFYSGYL